MEQKQEQINTVIQIREQPVPPVVQPVQQGFCQTFFYFFDIPPQQQQQPVAAIIPYFTILQTLILTAIYIWQEVSNIVTPVSLNDIHAGLRWKPTNNYDIWYRSFTYMYFHFNITHYITNIVLFIIVSWYLEYKYKWYRILPITAIGGYFSGLSAVAFQQLTFPSKLIVYAGYSGAIYTLLGLYISESIINSESVRNWIIRGTITAGIVATPIIETIFLRDSIAVSIHITGMLIGISPAMLYLPNKIWHNYEWIFVIIALILSAFFFITIPVYDAYILYR